MPRLSNSIFKWSDFGDTTHLKRNLLNKTHPKHKVEVAEDLLEVFDIDNQNDTIKEAMIRFQQFSQKWGKHYSHLKKAGSNETNELYFTYLKYHPKIRRMIYTTNWIEKLNKEFRRTFKIRNSMPSYESALTLLSKVAMDKEDGYFKYPIHNFKFKQTMRREV